MCQIIKAKKYAIPLWGILGNVFGRFKLKNALKIKFKGILDFKEIKYEIIDLELYEPTTYFQNSCLIPQISFTGILWLQDPLLY